MKRFLNVIESEQWKSRLTPQRLQRLEQIEACLIRFMTVDQIVRKLKIGRPIVLADVKFIQQSLACRKGKEYWKQKIMDTFEHQLKELWEQWDASKDNPSRIITYQDGTVVEIPGKADPRWQSGILAVAKEIANVAGLKESSVEEVVVTEETKKALAPMSIDEYKRLMEAGPIDMSKLAIDVEVIKEG